MGLETQCCVYSLFANDVYLCLCVGSGSTRVRLSWGKGATNSVARGPTQEQQMQMYMYQQQMMAQQMQAAAAAHQYYMQQQMLAAAAAEAARKKEEAEGPVVAVENRDGFLGRLGAAGSIETLNKTYNALGTRGGSGAFLAGVGGALQGHRFVRHFP